MKVVVIIVCVLVVLLVAMGAYMIVIQGQLYNINRQLKKRLTEHTQQPVSLELLNKGLNELTANINKCFKAEESLRLKGVREEKQFKAMIANISHDLRTPLTAVKGYQQLMEKDELSENQRIKLHIAQKHAYELGSLLEHFFEYAYLLNAKAEPCLEKINLSNLVTECIAQAVSIFEAHQLAVHIQAPALVYALADCEMVTRIIHNLIHNCIAHSSGNITVEIQAEPSAEKAVIIFCNPVDNPDEIEVSRLFERFYTADQVRGKTTGLGLSIVAMLAEQMNGYTKAKLQGKELYIYVMLPGCKPCPL